MPDHDPGLQRHHLLPRQLLARPSFGTMFEEVGGKDRHFEDFRQNGMLLPCRESAALRMGLPLHRGPHSRYTELVIERVGQIEEDWSELNQRDPQAAADRARMRLDLLRRALRRYLLDSRRRRLQLNARDPLPLGVDFADLDSLVEALWTATAPEPVAGFADAPVPPMPARQPRLRNVDPAVQVMPVRRRSSSSAR